MTHVKHPPCTPEIELDLLLAGIHRRYGFDFRDYARSSLTRRIAAQMAEEGARTLSGFQALVLHDDEVMERLLLALSVNVSSMFRDPPFYAYLRHRVVPVLRTYPFIRIWTVGCSTGEEVYSIAILLQEEGIYDRCRIYATDMNEAVLARAAARVFGLESMQEYTRNYIEAGGKSAFSEYYSAHHGAALFRPDLAERVVFSQHNLTCDRSFNEFHLILCRNVMIYFNRDLQARVHQLFHESLVRLGILGLGLKETLNVTPLAGRFEALDAGLKIYRKTR